MTQKHEFALYLKDLSVYLSGKKIDDTITISDPVLIQRISSILRLKIHEMVRLFDEEYNALFELRALEKKQMSMRIADMQKNAPLHPPITVLLPLLKREALSDAVYSCAEMGAQEIKLIITEKSQRTSTSEHLKKVIIAAAEQSKYFSMPVLKEPILLEPALKSLTVQDKLFFDPGGAHASLSMSQLQQSQGITLLVGPEGDFTDSEKKLIKNYGFTFCSLTPTVLRASQAVAVGLGLVRSMIHN